MAGKKSGNARVEVVFIRKSGTSQENKDQIANVERMLADLGVTIPDGRWFVGTVSRRKVHTNDQFATLIGMVERDEVGTVYVESQDRFGTADRPELFTLIGTFRQHGTRLFDLRAGMDITLDDIATEVMAFVASLKSSQELKDTSYRSLRSRVNNFLATGSWPTGPAPFGYGKRCVSEDGRTLWEWHPSSRTLGRVYHPKGKRLEPGTADIKIPRKDKRDRIVLVPHRERRYVEAVRLAFDLYTTQGLTRRAISQRLNDSEFTHYRKPFTHGIVNQILTNPAYVGDTHFGKTRTGELHTFDADGTIVETSADGRSERSEDGRLVRTDTHEGLIDRATWSRACKKRESEGKRTAYAPRNAAYYLKPILVCGHCGKTMTGRMESAGPKYVCPTYTAGRSNGHDSPCGYQSIRHDDAERMMLDKIADEDLRYEADVSERSRKNLEEHVRRLDAADDAADDTWGEVIDEGINAFVGYIFEHYGPVNDYREVRKLRRMAERMYADRDNADVTPLRRLGLDESQLRDAVNAAERRTAEHARERLESARDEHRAMTVAWAKATDMQKAVLTEEAKRLENEIARWEPLAVPIGERLEAFYAAEDDRAEERRQLVAAMPEMEARERGEAFRRVFDTVTLYWDREWIEPKTEGATGRYRYTIDHARIEWSLADSGLNGCW